MTTDGPRRAPAREIDVGALQLYAVAALAAVYLVSWWAFTPTEEPVASLATAPPAVEASVATAPARVRAPTVTRRPPARRVRVRTRSS